MLCSDESASEHSEHLPVHPVRLVLSDTAKLPVSLSDTCEWDPNYQISDSLLAQPGSQEERQHDGNKENDPVTQATVLDENRFGYSLLSINPLQHIKEKDVYEHLINEKRALYEVHIIIIL